MITLLVSAKRSFEVRAKSVLAATHLAAKVAIATASAVWFSLESVDEVLEAYPGDKLVKLVNSYRESLAKETAKTTSPWADLELMVGAAMRIKGLSAQEALDMIVGFGLGTIPAFTDSAPTDSTPAEVNPADILPAQDVPADVPAEPVAAEVKAPKKPRKA